MNHNEYQCASCLKVFTKVWSDEEAEAEAMSRFGVPTAAKDPGMAVVCSACYQKILNRLGAS